MYLSLVLLGSAHGLLLLPVLLGLYGPEQLQQIKAPSIRPSTRRMASTPPVRPFVGIFAAMKLLPMLFMHCSVIAVAILCSISVTQCICRDDLCGERHES
jgi:hypothetical protein